MGVVCKKNFNQKQFVTMTKTMYFVPKVKRHQLTKTTSNYYNFLAITIITITKTKTTYFNIKYQIRY